MRIFFSLSKTFLKRIKVRLQGISSKTSLPLEAMIYLEIADAILISMVLVQIFMSSLCITAEELKIP